MQGVFLMKMHQKRATIKTLMAILGLAWATAASAVDIELPLQQVESGNFYLDATLDNIVQTELLFDTGSGYVSLSKRTFDRIKSDPGTVFSRHISGRMANGRTVSVPVYTIRELSLSAECVLSDLEVVVFPNADRDILGLNALRKLQPFTFQMDPPMLSASC